MKIAVVWDWEPEFEQSVTWADGLAAALKDLSTRHEVKMFCPGNGIVIPNPYIPIHTVENVPYSVEQYNPDAILVWADGTRPNIPLLHELNIPMYLLFSGGETNLHTFGFFKHIFVESSSYLKTFQEKGYSTSIAFGTNTDLFQPIPQPKTIDFLFPATFALWKRHDLFAEAVAPIPGVKIACGYIQRDGHERECYDVCTNNNVIVLPHLSAQALHRLYAASKKVVITSETDGGSQRTVLEAMAMNIPLIVTNNSEKTTEYLLDGGFGTIVDPTIEAIRQGIQVSPDTINTRDYILSKWSHLHYAKALEDVIA